jgi:Pyruvate/2-oxoacid:ferredoxin oxidoreductase gamma subunit
MTDLTSVATTLSLETEDMVALANKCLLGLPNLTVVFAGVGGQGIIHLSKEVISGLEKRFDRILSTQHRGLAKARGSVAVHMRAGKNIQTAEIFSGRVDLLIALELHEAIRHLPMLDKDSVCLFADLAIGASPRRPVDRAQLLEQMEEHLSQINAISLALPLHQEMQRRPNFTERHVALALLGTLSRLLSLPKFPAEKTKSFGFDSFAWGQNWIPCP